jgi:hypothetical protein
MHVPFNTELHGDIQTHVTYLHAPSTIAFVNAYLRKRPSSDSNRASAAVAIAVIHLGLVGVFRLTGERRAGKLCRLVGRRICRSVKFATLKFRSTSDFKSFAYVLFRCQSREIDVLEQAHLETISVYY